MADAGNEDSGLLGNLPNRRPGVESPRRAEARRAAARRKAPDPADVDPGGGVGAPADGGESGFEQLARASAGLAVGVAGAGLRLAGRAAGEIGKVVGRR
jgi:hypothetical protein